MKYFITLLFSFVISILVLLRVSGDFFEVSIISFLIVIYCELQRLGHIQGFGIISNIFNRDKVRQKYLSDREEDPLYKEKNINGSDVYKEQNIMLINGLGYVILEILAIIFVVLELL